MRTARVLQSAHLEEMPDQDAGAEPVVQVLTDLATGDPSAFYMEPVDPMPAIGEAISFDIPAGLLGTHHEVEWRGRRYRQRGYSFDPDEQLH